jgi:signal transduction histidine kinase
MARGIRNPQACGVRSHLASRLERSLAGPEVSARSYEGMLALAQRVQLAIGATALVAMWALPGMPSRAKLTVTLLLLCVYLPWSLLGPTTGKASGVVARIANMVMDLAAIGMFAVVIPETRVAVMVGFVLMVAFHAYVGGRAAGFAVIAGVVAVGALAEWQTPPADRSNSFTVVMYVAVLVGLTVMLDGLGAERRRLVRHLSRLHAALQQVSAAPSLKETLDSVGATAREAVHAGLTVVLMRGDDGRIEAMTHAGTEELTAKALQAERDGVLDVIAEHPETAPGGVAMLTGRPVTVSDIRADERFSSWAALSGEIGIRSMVFVPLTVQGQPVGVLGAFWAGADAFDDDDVDLLAAYANGAGLAVARAVAFDREQQAASKLADADELKSEFVARVSHELRTPLTAINGFIATLLLHWDGIDDTAKRDLLTRASWNAGELRRMVEQVLAFERSGASDVTVAPVPCALASELDLLIGRMLPVVADHPVELSVPGDLVVRADREALHHVMTNLLSNAAKFSPDGSPIHVTARVAPGAPGEVEVSVRDEGPGIAPDELPRVFERFYRGRSVSARGTGIGLSIVRSYVEQLGGRVWAESTPGEGATFAFTLPAAAEDGLVAGGGDDGEHVHELPALA